MTSQFVVRRLRVRIVAVAVVLLVGGGAAPGVRAFEPDKPVDISGVVALLQQKISDAASTQMAGSADRHYLERKQRQLRNARELVAALPYAVETARREKRLTFQPDHVDKSAPVNVDELTRVVHEILDPGAKLEVELKDKSCIIRVGRSYVWLRRHVNKDGVSSCVLSSVVDGGQRPGWLHFSGPMPPRSQAQQEGSQSSFLAELRGAGHPAEPDRITPGATKVPVTGTTTRSEHLPASDPAPALETIHDVVGALSALIVETSSQAHPQGEARTGHQIDRGARASRLPQTRAQERVKWLSHLVEALRAGDPNAKMAFSPDGVRAEELTPARPGVAAEVGYTSLPLTPVAPDAAEGELVRVVRHLLDHGQQAQVMLSRHRCVFQVPGRGRLELRSTTGRSCTVRANLHGGEAPGYLHAYAPLPKGKVTVR